MCIRDRMLLLRACNAQDSESEAQKFFGGLLSAQKFPENNPSLRYIAAQSFNFQAFNAVQHSLKAATLVAKENAITGLRDVFVSFSEKNQNLLKNDIYFKTALGNVVWAFSDFKAFESRVSLYKQKFGRGAYDDLIQMFNQIAAKDYRGAGWTLGNLATQLRKLVSLEEPNGIEKCYQLRGLARELCIVAYQMSLKLTIDCRIVTELLLNLLCQYTPCLLYTSPSPRDQA
eukprot:TRINITY_DN9989_c0_g1_i1.p1 TRINITY_DN9989_c0_g1~~TRINITY_DN9989_c0_g1_i1.p1  ORF type:complete len:250 (+),score=46.92 TRINITY_DN9989_c0_g1_i1:61-750(+)